MTASTLSLTPVLATRAPASASSNSSSAAGPDSNARSFDEHLRQDEKKAKETAERSANSRANRSTANNRTEQNQRKDESRETSRRARTQDSERRSTRESDAAERSSEAAEDAATSGNALPADAASLLPGLPLAQPVSNATADMQAMAGTVTSTSPEATSRLTSELATSAEDGQASSVKATLRSADASMLAQGTAPNAAPSVAGAADDLVRAAGAAESAGNSDLVEQFSTRGRQARFAGTADGLRTSATRAQPLSEGLDWASSLRTGSDFNRLDGAWDTLGATARNGTGLDATASITSPSTTGASAASASATPTGVTPAAATAATPVSTMSPPGQTTATQFGGSLELTQPFGSAAWQDELGGRLQWLADQRIGSADLKLNPRELGPLEISLRVVGDEVSATFQAQHGATREAVEQALPRLREMLAESGLQLADANVGSGQSEAGDQSRQDQNDGLTAAASLRTADDSAEGMLESAPERSMASLGNGMLDLYA